MVVRLVVGYVSLLFGRKQITVVEEIGVTLHRGPVWKVLRESVDHRLDDVHPPPDGSERLAGRRDCGTDGFVMSQIAEYLTGLMLRCVETCQLAESRAVILAPPDGNREPHDVRHAVVGWSVLHIGALETEVVETPNVIVDLVSLV